MRRFLALAALLVLSLSRFGAPAPAHVHTWALDRVASELGAAVPGARLAEPAARELAQRSVPRAPAPWLPMHEAEPFGLRLPITTQERTPTSAERWWRDGWHRFTYDATAPPHLS